MSCATRIWPSRLKEACRLTPFAREEFNAAIDRSDPVEWARGVVFRSFAGFASASASSDGYATGFRANAHRNGTTPAKDWANWPSHVDQFTERLRGVVIECKDAVAVMAQHDSTETLHYVDPPYMHETRSAAGRKAYGDQEMSTEDHLGLLSFLKTLKGKVVLSGYRTDLYDKELEGWRRVDFKALADGAKKRTESLWMNYNNLTLFT